MACPVMRLSRRMLAGYISQQIRPQSLTTRRFDGLEPVEKMLGIRTISFRNNRERQPTKLLEI